MERRRRLGLCRVALPGKYVVFNDPKGEVMVQIIGVRQQKVMIKHPQYTNIVYVNPFDLDFSAIYVEDDSQVNTAEDTNSV
jgi:hypothetical protein